MRIAIPHEAERFGANLIHAIQRVYELDAGLSEDVLPGESLFTVRHITREVLYEIQKDMAIIIPVKNLAWSRKRSSACQPLQKGTS
jgi:mannosyl-3-phosphoglycerate synthase